VEIDTMTEAAVATQPTTAEASQQAAPQVSSEERIRIRAYELFEMRNGSPGDAVSDWYLAEAELRAEGTEPVK
jgi:hypothetical protein